MQTDAVQLQRQHHHIPEGKLAVIQGAENFIIAETDNVLLICKKDQEQRIRDFVNETKVQMGDEFV